MPIIPFFGGQGQERRWPLQKLLTFINRGRVLGGSSAINFVAWNKPSREDIDGEDNHATGLIFNDTGDSMGEVGQQRLELGYFRQIYAASYDVRPFF